MRLSKSNVYNVVISQTGFELATNQNILSEYTTGIFYVLLPHFQSFTHNRCQSSVTDVLKPGFIQLTSHKWIFGAVC